MNALPPVSSSPIPAQHQSAAVKKEETSEKSVLSKITDYLEPRPDTTGDLPYSSPKSAVIGGAIKGLVSTGIPGAAAGAVSGYAGVRVGEETGSLAKGITAGAVTGAGSLLLAGAATAAIAGGPVGAAATMGLMAASGAVGGAVGNLVETIQGKEEATALSKAAGKLASAAAGAGMGAALGAIGGPVTAAAGAVVGAAGALAGGKLAQAMDTSSKAETKGEMAKSAALAAGVTAGAGVVAGAALTAAASTNPAAAALALGTTALIGGLTGTTATISGSRIADIRDGSLGASMAATVVQGFTGVGGSALSLAASIGGAAGANAETTAGKLAAASLTGGAIGAATGIIGGPVGMAVGAAAGAGTAVAGAFAGPKIQQGIRNLTADMQKKLTPLMSKVSTFLIDKLGETKGMAALGALTGALGSVSIASLGALLLGPVGAALTVAGSAALGGIKFAQTAKQLEEAKMIGKNLAEHGPSMEDINLLMCAQAFRNIEPQLGSMSDQEKEGFFRDLVGQSMEELKTLEPELQKFTQQLGIALQGQMKDELKEIKGKENKEEFVREQIQMSRQELTGVYANQVVAIIQARDEQNQQAQEMQPDSDSRAQESPQ